MIVRRALAGAAAAFAVTSAVAQTPSGGGPIRIVVPFGPGGSTDIMGRAMAQKLSERIGQSVIVENRSGANGTIGAAFVAKSPGDGRTMLLVQTGFVSNTFLYRKLPYDQARDLAPVTVLASGPLVLTVHPSLGVKSVKDLVDLARAKPGEINFASSGSGSLTHLAAEAFGVLAQVKMTHVPYKGTGPALVDVMRGQVPVTFMNLMLAMPYIKGDKLRAIGVTTRERSPIAPDIPTIAEGGLREFEIATWYGILVPSTTPRPAIAKLQQDLAQVVRSPEVVERLNADGVSVVASTPEQFGELLRSETEKYGRLIKAAGIEAGD